MHLKPNACDGTGTLGLGFAALADRKIFGYRHMIF